MGQTGSQRRRGEDQGLARLHQWLGGLLEKMVLLVMWKTLLVSSSVQREVGGRAESVMTPIEGGVDRVSNLKKSLAAVSNFKRLSYSVEIIHACAGGKINDKLGGLVH